MDITGTIRNVLPPKTGEGKNGPWKKQEVILETEGKYPKNICFTFWGDKAESPLFRNGSAVKISYDLESREFNGRWYTDAKGWKVEPAGGEAPQISEDNTIYHDESNAPTDADDLPF